MKNFLQFGLVLLSSLILVSCSTDDEAPVQVEEFLGAKLDGVDFLLKEVKCTRIINDRGTIDLWITSSSDNGEILEFLVYDYYGVNSYLVGDDYLNQNWISYSQTNPEGHWKATKNHHQRNIIEILEDDGDFIKGRFSFEGYNEADLSTMQISDGNFNVRVSY